VNRPRWRTLRRGVPWPLVKDSVRSFQGPGRHDHGDDRGKQAHGVHHLREHPGRQGRENRSRDGLPARLLANATRAPRELDHSRMLTPELRATFRRSVAAERSRIYAARRLDPASAVTRVDSSQHPLYRLRWRRGESRARSRVAFDTPAGHSKAWLRLPAIRHLHRVPPRRGAAA